LISITGRTAPAELAYSEFTIRARSTIENALPGVGLYAMPPAEKASQEAVYHQGAKHSRKCATGRGPRDRTVHPTVRLAPEPTRAHSGAVFFRMDRRVPPTRARAGASRSRLKWERHAGEPVTRSALLDVGTANEASAGVPLQAGASWLQHLHGTAIDPESRRESIPSPTPATRDAS